MIKVIVLGSNGLIGNTLSKYLANKKINLLCGVRSKKKVFNKKINFFYYSDLNKKKNFNSLNKIIKKFNPNYIINCCGITKHTSKKKNSVINNGLPLFLSKLSCYKKFKFIHISTDCVFSGKKGNYTENCIQDAKENYGKIKAVTENVLKKNKNTITLRTSTIGHEIKTKSGLLEWFLQKKGGVYGYNKAYFSGPTSLELSKIIHSQILIKKKIKFGLYNVSGYKINKFNLLVMINHIYNKNSNICKNNKIIVDRSLSSSKFLKVTNYKKKKWLIMIKEMKLFYEKYF